MRFIAAAAAAGVAAATVYPTFPTSWSSFVETDLLQAAGSFNDAAGNICCTINDVQCQVQVQAQAGETYCDGLNNQTSSVNPPGSQYAAIVSVWHLNKEMAVDENWVCQSFCPLDAGRWTGCYGVDGATDMGPTTLNGQAVWHYQYTDIIPYVNITAEVQDIYVVVTNSTANGQPLTAIPFLEMDQLTLASAVTNTTYGNFVPGQPSPQWFNVTGIAECPMDSGCNSDAVRQRHRLATGRSGSFQRAVLRAQQEQARQTLARAEALSAALEGKQ